MTKVIFVCMSNFCRSPLAQGVFEKLIAIEGLQGSIEVDSAGTHDYQIGLAPDKHSQSVARAHGFDISAQQARQIDLHDFPYYDHIIAMDCHNLAYLKSIAPSQCLDKIDLLMRFATRHPIQDIPDPYQKSQNGFDLVYELIEDGAQGLLEQIKKAK